MDKADYYLLRRHLDPVSFLEGLVRVETQDGLVPWKMDSYQKNLVRDTSRNRAINKSKKTGISTCLAGEAIHKAYTQPGRQMALVSTGQRIAGELLGKFYDEYNTIPGPLRVSLGRESAERVEFPNGARIFSLPSGNPETIRGLGMRGTATDVVLDEYAFAPNDKELWIVVRDFQRFGGNITLNSTPKGKRGKYYQIAEPLQVVHRKLGDYQPTDWSYHEIPYTRCKRLKDQEKSLKEDIDELEFQEEYCCEFLDESLSYFPYEMIWEAQKGGVKKYLEEKSEHSLYMGIDLGLRVSETVIFVVEEYEPEKFKVIFIEPLPGVDYTDQVEVIKSLNTIFDPVTINVDASGPGGIFMYETLSKSDELASKVWGLTFTAQFKEKLMIRTRNLMNRGRLTLPDKSAPYGEILERQLHQMRKQTTISGEHTRYTGKLEGSGMDDYVWALALAVWKESGTGQWEAYFETTEDEALKKINRR